MKKITQITSKVSDFSTLTQQTYFYHNFPLIQPLSRNLSKSKKHPSSAAAPPIIDVQSTFNGEENQ